MNVNVNLLWGVVLLITVANNIDGAEINKTVNIPRDVRIGDFSVYSEWLKVIDYSYPLVIKDMRNDKFWISARQSNAGEVLVFSRSRKDIVSYQITVEFYSNGVTVNSKERRQLGFHKITSNGKIILSAASYNVGSIKYDQIILKVKSSDESDVSEKFEVQIKTQIK